MDSILNKVKGGDNAFVKGDIITVNEQKLFLEAIP